MDHDHTPGVETGLAAHAFSELRAEISLLRRATERLTDERTAQPDYAPSLAAIGKRLEDVCGWAQRISEKPAMKLTPDSVANGIIDAATTSRVEDRRMLEQAADRMKAAGSRIDETIARSRTVAEQNRQLTRNRVAFAVAGVALWAILPGAVARSLPVRWAVPERIAARILGTDMWHAGLRMMAKADPKAWSALLTHMDETQRTEHIATGRQSSVHARTQRRRRFAR